MPTLMNACADGENLSQIDLATATTVDKSLLIEIRAI